MKIAAYEKTRKIVGQTVDGVSCLGNQGGFDVHIMYAQKIANEFNKHKYRLYDGAVWKVFDFSWLSNFVGKYARVNNDGVIQFSYPHAIGSDQKIRYYNAEIIENGQRATLKIGKESN